jgi:peptidoglycan/xylan/chitin deacetylase (PgdA/CDA1 family)
MSAFTITAGDPVGSRRATLNLIAGTLWYAPGRFGLARFFGPQYALRCILFHDIADTESSFTKGLGVTVTRKDFEAALKFITRHYTAVSLQDVVADRDGRELPSRPVLVTFDDAYVSVREFAAPLCAKFGVPALFFVNGSCLGNRRLALENLLCYVANQIGLGTINAAIRSVNGNGEFEVASLSEVFSRFLPKTSLLARDAFRDALVELSRIDESGLAAEAGLYISDQHLRDLVAFKFEIGNHTYSHANCRTLSTRDFAGEIDRNKAVLESASGTRVRSFSVPYGSSADLTGDLAAHLEHSGYEAVFLAQGLANTSHARGSQLDRVSIKASTDAALFSEIEILPRLRTIRNSMVRRSRVESCNGTCDFEAPKQPRGHPHPKKVWGSEHRFPRESRDTERTESFNLTELR